MEVALSRALDALATRYPGESGKRQPVHTVYGGGHLFKADTAVKLGFLALKSLDENAPDALTFARAVGLHEANAEVVYERVRRKLEREAVEDFRIDFEDGYGNRPDDEEDGHVVAAAKEVAAGASGGTLPPFIGIRIKPLTRDLYARSIRTLELFVTTLVQATNKLPTGFAITLPKIQVPEQVSVTVDRLEALEKKLDLAAGSLPLELMIETPQSIMGPRGESLLPAFLDASRGRCIGAHFGTYDYTASCSITAAHQHMLHPACDFARHMMQVAFAGTGVFLSDGATNIMPVGPHKSPANDEERKENHVAVHRAWRLHVEHIRHSLANAYYQGWDLHPAQLPTRYAAVFDFFLDGLAPATERLRNFVDKAAQATLVGDVFDDAATGQGLLNFFLRGLSCGALTEQEALATGLTLEEYRGRSFLKVLENRRAK